MHLAHDDVVAYMQSLGYAVTAVSAAARSGPTPGMFTQLNPAMEHGRRGLQQEIRELGESTATSTSFYVDIIIFRAFLSSLPRYARRAVCYGLRRAQALLDAGCGLRSDVVSIVGATWGPLLASGLQSRPPVHDSSMHATFIFFQAYRCTSRQSRPTSGRCQCRPSRSRTGSSGSTR